MICHGPSAMGSHTNEALPLTSFTEDRLCWQLVSFLDCMIKQHVLLSIEVNQFPSLIGCNYLRESGPQDYQLDFSQWQCSTRGVGVGQDHLQHYFTCDIMQGTVYLKLFEQK